MFRSTKKFLIAAITFLLLSPFLLSQTEKAKAYDVFTISPVPCAFSGEQLVGGDYLAQTFVTSVDMLVNVGVSVQNRGAGPVKFNLALSDPSGHFIASRPQSLSPGATWPYRYIDPQDPIPTTPGGRYAIWIYPYSGYENNQLFVGTSPAGYDGCYPNGTAWKNIFTPLNRDLAFAAFVYSSSGNPPEDITPDTGPPPSESSLPEVSSGSEAAISATTSTTANKTSSNAPKNLAAVYDNKTQSAKLVWEASTLSGITTYEIFKANVKTNSFAKIGDAAKDKLEFSDKNIQYGEQYNYYVVAVSASARSDNSNIANIVIDDQGLKSPSATATEKSFWQKKLDYLTSHSWVIYVLGGLAIILLALLIYLLKRKNSQKQLK